MSTEGMCDGGASQYLDHLNGSLSRPLEARCVLHVAGAASGRDIVDLGCGTGWYGRQMLASGARRAVGVDCTPDMLAQAHRLSKEGGDAMQFVQGDLRDLQLDEAFDIAIAAWVFCHAASTFELKQMYHSAAAVLRPGGRLVAVVNNPEYRLQEGDWSTYGAKALKQEPHHDADRLTFEFTGEPPLRIVDYQWSVRAHQAAAGSAGFGALSWHCPVPDAEDTAAFPPGFWDEYEHNPAPIVLSCLKARDVPLQV